MIGKVYLKIATRALVFAAALEVAAKELCFTPLKSKVNAYFKSGHYGLWIVAALELLLLFICYKLLSKAILWAFHRSWRVRILIDPLFDVEGPYLESVYINGELEVVGINRVHFTGGELKVHSVLRRPERDSKGVVALTVCAETKSVDELCTTSGKELQYVFEDVYVDDSSKNKTGLTKLTLHREQRPSWLRRLFGHPMVDRYTGGFDSFDLEIRGQIKGRRLAGKDAHKALAADDQPRLEMLTAEVNEILKSPDIKLRIQPPGVVVPPGAIATPQGNHS